MSKQGKFFRLEETTITYIAEYRQRHGVSEAEALAMIVEEHRRHSDEFAGAVAEKVYDKLIDTLTRIRLGVNNAERNTQVELELWNTLLIVNDIGKLYSTEKHTAEALKEAQSVVKKRIAEWRQKKLDAKSKIDKASENN